MPSHKDIQKYFNDNNLDFVKIKNGYKVKILENLYYQFNFEDGKLSSFYTGDDIVLDEIYEKIQHMKAFFLEVYSINDDKLISSITWQSLENDIFSNDLIDDAKVIINIERQLLENNIKFERIGELGTIYYKIKKHEIDFKDNELYFDDKVILLDDLILKLKEDEDNEDEKGILDLPEELIIKIFLCCPTWSTYIKLRSINSKFKRISEDDQILRKKDKIVKIISPNWKEIRPKYEYRYDLKLDKYEFMVYYYKKLLSPFIEK
jgi:hypothetical protein